MTNIHAYLRASTLEQDASRAIDQINAFVAEQGKVLASTTVENISGAILERPKLMSLIDSMSAGDVLLIEQVDRLTRLLPEDWEKLKTVISGKGINIVALDLPTSHAVLSSTSADAFTLGVLKAINGMLLDILAVTARKDYEDRRGRQAQGISKTEHVYAGKPADRELHKKIRRALSQKHSQRTVAKLCDCSLSTVQRIVKADKAVAGDSHKQTAMRV